MAQEFGNTRFVYNYLLAKSIEDYHQNSDAKWNKYEYIKAITQLKKDWEHDWLKLSNSQSLQAAVWNLDVAYNRFFKWIARFPKFKKKRSKQSFHVPQSCSIVGNRVKVPKYSPIKFVQHRPIEGKIRSMTISQDSSWRYFVSVLVEQEDYEVFPQTGNEVGIDLGLKDLAITSDGDVYKTIKYNDTKIRRLQMWQSKKVQWSRRYKRLKTKVAKLHAHNADIRADYLHKISHEIVKKYDLIGLENLNIKGMMKNRKLSYCIWQQWRNKLVTMLEYKAIRHWKITHKVDRRYPSSKQCNNCGNVKRDLKLSDRTYECTKCWLVADRDVNAAKNILQYTKVEMSL